MSLLRTLAFWRPSAASEPPAALTAALQAGETTLAAACLAIISRFREVAKGRVDRVVSTSERDVLAIGQDLREIVTITQEQIKQMRESLAGMGAQGQEVSLAARLADHSHALAEYLDTVRTLIGEQSAVTDRAVSAMTQIVDLNRRVEDVLSQTKLLSLNARIEASRLGAAGAAVNVIAGEMGRLSDEVEATNAIAARLNTGLLAALPKIAACSKNLAARSEQLGFDLTARLSGIEKTIGELQDSVGRIMKDGDVRLERVREHTYSALSHLQFQDPCSQSLRIVDEDFGCAEDAVAAAIEAAGVADTGVPSELAAARSVASRSDKVHAGEVVALQSGTHPTGPEPGDVLLF